MRSALASIGIKLKNFCVQGALGKPLLAIIGTPMFWEESAANEEIESNRTSKLSAVMIAMRSLSVESIGFIPCTI